MTGDRAATVDDVFELYERWGAGTYDEELRQLDHGLQTAALARAAGASAALVAAALLHDVGHLLDMADAAGGSAGGPGGDGGPAGRRPGDDTVDRRHEARGAAWLSGLFGPAVTAPIALHVRAKRYRVAVDPGYAAALSAGSVASLARQGGPLCPDEVAAFESNPGWRDAVALRGWDDGAKVKGLAIPGLDTYRPLVEALVVTGGSSGVRVRGSRRSGRPPRSPAARR